MYIFICGCLYRHTTSMASLADNPDRSGMFARMRLNDSSEHEITQIRYIDMNTSSPRNRSKHEWRTSLPPQETDHTLLCVQPENSCERGPKHFTVLGFYEFSRCQASPCGGQLNIPVWPNCRPAMRKHHNIMGVNLVLAIPISSWTQYNVHNRVLCNICSGNWLNLFETSISCIELHLDISWRCRTF